MSSQLADLELVGATLAVSSLCGGSPDGRASRRKLFGDLRLDPFTIRAAVVLRDLFPEARDRLRGRRCRGLAELIARSPGRHSIRHAVDPVRLPVTARAMATIRAATRTKKMIERSVAISTTGVPAGCAKIPRNGATSGSVIP